VSTPLVDIVILDDRYVTVGALRGPGDVVTVSAEDADTLVREGYARHIDDPPPAELVIPRTVEEPLPEGGARLRDLPGAPPKRSRDKAAGGARRTGQED